MTRALVSLLAVLILAGPASAARFALLVGNSTAGQDGDHLQYVNNDLGEMRNVLVSVCGFDKANVVSVYNGTSDDLDLSLRAASTRLADSSRENLFLLYYSGHADAENLRLGDSRYPLSKLKQAFSGLKAQIRIGIFDACQSGTVTRIKGGHLAEPFLFDSDAKVEGQVILSSSSARENSQESDMYRNSVFTFHLVNALRGSGDASGDGKVTLSEAYQYAYNRTVSTTVRSPGRAQHPAYQFRIQGEGDIVLADLNIRTSGIILGQEIEGNLTVFDERDNIVADLPKAPNSQVMLALNPGAYQLVLRRDSSTFVARQTVSETVPTLVSNAGFVEVEQRPISRAKGSEPGGFRFSFVMGCRYDRLSLTDFDASVKTMLDPYGFFGLSANPAAPRGRFSAVPGFEMQFGPGVLLGMSLSYYTFGDQEVLTARKVNLADSASYGYRLDYRLGADVLSVCMGAGFKVPRGILRNLSAHVGLNVCRVGVSASTSFCDSLYNVQSSATLQDKGILVVPSFGLAYRYPLHKRIDVGAMVRYRYQSAATELSRQDEGFGDEPGAVPGSQSSPPAFTFSLRGVDGQVFVTLNLGG